MHISHVCLRNICVCILIFTAEPASGVWLCVCVCAFVFIFFNILHIYCFLCCCIFLRLRRANNFNTIQSTFDMLPPTGRPLPSIPPHAHHRRTARPAVPQSFVHISTLYCNCNRKFIKEQVYENEIGYEKIMQVSRGAGGATHEYYYYFMCIRNGRSDWLNNLFKLKMFNCNWCDCCWFLFLVSRPAQIYRTFDDETLEKLRHCLIGKMPNTYTMTKKCAENLVNHRAFHMPAGIFRPPIGKQKIVAHCEWILCGSFDVALKLTSQTNCQIISP